MNFSAHASASVRFPGLMSASDAEAAAAVSGAGLMPRSVLDKMAAIHTTEIVSHAVWLYDFFGLNLRDVELDLAERGVVVTPEDYPAMVQKVRLPVCQTPEPAAAKVGRHVPALG